MSLVQLMLRLNSWFTSAAAFSSLTSGWKSWKKIVQGNFETICISGRDDLFHRVQFVWHQTMSAVSQLEQWSAACVGMNMDIWENPDIIPRIAPSRGYPDTHLIHVPWAQISVQPKLHLDWFSHFCRLIHVTDTQADTNTHRPYYITTCIRTGCINVT